MRRKAARSTVPAALAARPGPDVPGCYARAEMRTAGQGGVLLVVESPAKARTLKRMLGPGYDVRASSGHVKDLPVGRMGVDVRRGFEPQYDLVRGKARILSELKRAARGAERVLLATDPDREGEAIAWHLAEEIGAGGGDPRVRRVLLHEITPDAVAAALASPLELDRRRYDAQQARRILDRMVGFGLSPILARRVRRGLSAGRVQSVAVRLVVEREREIVGFRPEESFGVEASLAAAAPPEIRARLVKLDGADAAIRDGEAARTLAAELGSVAFVVASVEREEAFLPPPPPFTTATLQQEAARRLGMRPGRTMALAQRLYEGVELGDEGLVGLLSYPRTDSVRASAAAVDAARGLVTDRFGGGHLPDSPNVYEARSRGMMGAHEGVRPTSVAWTPERVAPHLRGPGSRDLLRLYALVWRRFVASQMRPAVHERTAARVRAGRATFLAEGSTLRFPGWIAAHGDRAPVEEGRALASPGELPLLEVGMDLRLLGLAPERYVTQAPPRHDEASLVRELEERGIGRPSTYASILETIQEREYIERVDRSFRPTRLGMLVTDVLTRAFPRAMDPAFTAGVEARLDAVEEGAEGWREVLAGFWGPFEEAMEKAKDELGERAETGITCEKCGKPMVVKVGRNGEFLACTGYPACRKTSDFRREGDRIVPVSEEPEPVADLCPRCGGAMVARRGRFGKFLACTRYPECKGTRPVAIGVACPLGCGGQVTERRSRAGKTFFGCSSWPACDFTSWDRPIDEACPDCGNAWLVEKVGRKEGPLVACPHRECGYRRKVAGRAPP